ncbi:MAG: ESPR-type extended signal peptide-containing protein, partial [Moraxella sp.]|nr:ESPR-type extended signal peptide-containing protein [Moraxella sp.]
MNKVYKVVWNKATGTWTAVSEMAVAQGKGSVRSQVGEATSLGFVKGGVSLVLTGLTAVVVAMMGSAVLTPAQAAAYCTGGVTAGGVGNDVVCGSTATSTRVSGLDSVVVGSGASSRSVGNVVVGAGASAGVAGATTGGGRTAIGSRASVTGDQSTAIGADVLASGDSSISIGGDDLDSVGGKSTTYNGQSMTVSAVYNTLTGQGGLGNRVYRATNASGGGSVAVGVQSLASGDLSTAFGTRTTAEGIAATALGVGASASQANSVALGSGATTTTNATYVPDVTVGGIKYTFAGGTRVLAGNQVSVGSAGYERQIKHVAPGQITLESTDAINGSQLYVTQQAIGAMGNSVARALGGSSTLQMDGSISAPSYNINGTVYNNVGEALAAATTHFYSVKSTDNTAGNYNNDGATGADALAAGVGATAVGANATAVGAGATADGIRSIAIGADNKATGTGARANGTDAVAIGTNASAPGGSAVALGLNATSNSIGSVVIGPNAVGGVTGTNSTSNAQHVAIGDQAQATGHQSIAIGLESKAATAGMAFGIQADAQGTGGIALGTKAVSVGEDSIVIGYNSGSTTNAANAIAMGTSSQVSVAGGVALGSESVASTAAGVKGYNPTTKAASTDTTATWESQLGAVSVGDTGKTRQITNVAAGFNDTDAVNVAQLKAAQAAATTHFYSVNSNDDTAGNYNNDGAKGVNALAAGVGATAVGKDAVAIGYNASATSTTDGLGAIAVGAGTTVNGLQSTAVGVSTTVTGAGNNALGSNVTVLGTQSVAVGNGVVVGAAGTTEVTAVGRQAKATGNQSTVIGATAQTTGSRSLAAGYGAAATAENAVAVGQSSVANKNNAIAVGSEAKAEGFRSVAVGRQATAAANDATALGRSANASLDNAVALGANATTATNATSETTATVNGISYSGFAGQAADDGMQVSVGAAGAERQIKNVAAGQISATSTDAINGSQLYQVANTLTNKGLTFTANTLADTDTDGSQQKLGSTVSIIGASTKVDGITRNTDTATAGAYSAKNLQTIVSDGEVQIQMAENPEFKAVTATTSITAGTGANQVVLDNAGVKVGGNTYINNDGLNAN